MATKDWKKVNTIYRIPKEINRWKNKNNNKVVSITFIKPSKIYRTSYFIGNFERYNTAKTKSQALKFAKSYMRKK